MAGESPSKRPYAGSIPVNRTMPFRKVIEIINLGDDNRVMRHVRLPQFGTALEAEVWLLQEGNGCWGDLGTLNLGIRTRFTNQRP